MSRTKRKLYKACYGYPCKEGDKEVVKVDNKHGFCIITDGSHAGEFYSRDYDEMVGGPKEKKHAKWMKVRKDRNESKRIARRDVNDFIEED